MGYEVTLSSKGQIVIPKDVRDALGLKTGEKLMLGWAGRRLTLDAQAAPRERISYAEFRRRVPKYEGPSVAVEDMTVDWDGLQRWRERYGA